MLGFHASMFQTLASGCVISNAGKIYVWVLCQSIWIVVYTSWFNEARRFYTGKGGPGLDGFDPVTTSEESHDEGETTRAKRPLGVALALSLCGTFLVLGNILLRIGFLLEDHGDI